MAEMESRVMQDEDGDSDSSSALDLMNEDDISFIEPARRSDTLSSKPGSEVNADTCRICRSEGSPGEPLFHPCKCSGSIKFVHQDCLMEWLAHSHKKHCELCKTPFRFTKLYDANMPQTLPWRVFIKTALIHTARTLVSACRGLLVGMVWMVILPWLVRWAWRWMFWMADAGWARETFMYKMRWDALTAEGGLSNNTSAMFATSFQQFLGLDPNMTEPIGLSVAKDVLTRLGLDHSILGTIATNGTVTSKSTMSWPQADESILSSWTYLSELTSKPAVNRVILDIFEGQLITCVVITGFILVFLIREWVVQQQPLVNLDQLNHLNNFQQLRQAADRIQADNDLLLRQQELINRARQRLAELQDSANALEQTIPVDFKGWDHLDASFDLANEFLRNDDQAEFLSRASLISNQRRAAKRAGIDLDEFDERMNGKLASFSTQERQSWEVVLLAGLTDSGTRFGERVIEPQPETGPSTQPAQRDQNASEARPVRPRIPSRGTSVDATEVKRLLEEVEAQMPRQYKHIDTSPPDIYDSNHDPAAEMQDSDDDEMPITNAGPDAKINIQTTGKGKLRRLNPPDDPVPNPSDDELKKKKQQTDDALASLEKEIKEEDAQLARRGAVSDLAMGNMSASPEPEDQVQPQCTQQDVQKGDTLAISLTPEVLNIANEDQERPTQLPESERSNEADLDLADAVDANEDDESGEQAQSQAAADPPIYLQPLADWFWGDIRPQPDAETVLAPNEERLDRENARHEAPFVPVEAGRPILDVVAAPDAAPHPDRDPEVLAAAAQAGVDAEAIEDAEDLEGILELLGLQGPLIGLIQTSTFCTVLVVGTVFGAVGLPYIWGKLVLSFIGDPIYFIFKMPLQLSSFIADLTIDIAILLSGWSIIVAALASDFLLSALEAWLPKLGGTKITEWIMEFAVAIAESSTARLQSALFLSEQTDMMGWNWAFLGASLHAHASLKNLGSEVDAVLNVIGATITAIVETISSGSVSIVWQRTLNACARVPEIPARLIAGVDVQQFMRPVMNFLSGLRSGALTFTIPESSLDPSLVYWSSTDRSLAVMTGYLALAALAAIYVALDTPITHSLSGQKMEKTIRDTLRQAGGVFKVILIISIEMLVFPFYCGVLLDIAFLPLFQDASVATRWAFATEYPYLFSFMHWFAGTCYMFHFALFVGMCRKILRKGVLWFIRDPDDPTFHPVRDVLERNVTTQLRKIAFSALVYGALVILCLGGVIWAIGRLFAGIFPIHWVSTEPVLEFPVDLLLYNAITPFLVHFFRPSDAVNTLYAWWLRRCARLLRLSHFLFDDRRKDEEGRYLHDSWLGLLLSRTQSVRAEQGITTIAEGESTSNRSHGHFRGDGKYVLTPCNDQYRPPKPGEAFLHFGEASESSRGDVYIADKDGNKNDHFAKVYIPPHFRIRVTIFMVCLWMFSVFMGLGGTLVPLVFGRRILASFQVVAHASRMNDIYAYSIGAYVLAGALAIVFQGQHLLRRAREQVSGVNVTGFLAHITEPLKRYALQALKCLYVYGFAWFVLPMLFAMCLQFYLIIPLHTYVASTASTQGTIQASQNSTFSAPTNSTVHQPVSPAVPPTFTLAHHSIHILQDYCLGLLYVRIFARLLSSAPHSRLTEGNRRVFARGHLNPDPRLATRFLVLPTLLLASVLLLGPPGLAALIPPTWVGIDKARIYRYSFPFAAMGAVAALVIRQIASLTGRWRARIRDEVYLVGERLHNFGERRPPVGSRTVVRRER
nr:erad-associated e3 ubiquitin-protein ligase doa10 [Quercus suber]